jgi:hypothetical protein
MLTQGTGTKSIANWFKSTMLGVFIRRSAPMVEKVPWLRILQSGGENLSPSTAGQSVSPMKM